MGDDKPPPRPKYLGVFSTLKSRLTKSVVSDQNIEIRIARENEVRNKTANLLLIYNFLPSNPQTGGTLKYINFVVGAKQVVRNCS